jgi:hypothetical protein
MRKLVETAQHKPRPNLEGLLPTRHRVAELIKLYLNVSLGDRVIPNVPR